MATTNFFTEISDMELTGELRLTISQGADGTQVVSVLLKNEECRDSAKKMIPPLIFRGTPEQLDEAFLVDLKTPVERASILMNNMDAYMQQLEQAKKHSAMQREKESKEKKGQDGIDKRFSDAMKKANELDGQGKHQDAWLLLSKLDGVGDHAEALRKRKTELRQKFAPDLFAPNPQPEDQLMYDDFSEDGGEEEEEEQY